EFTQANRSLRIDTPLGKDFFLIRELTGSEAISRLFEFQLEVVALTSSTVDFEKLLGQSISAAVELPGGGERHFSGMVRRLTQGGAALGPAELTGTSYRVEIVPKVWLLTRKVQSRIFQQMN